MQSRLQSLHFGYEFTYDIKRANKDICHSSVKIYTFYLKIKIALLFCAYRRALKSLNLFSFRIHSMEGNISIRKD